MTDPKDPLARALEIVDKLRAAVTWTLASEVDVIESDLRAAIRAMGEETGRAERELDVVRNALMSGLHDFVPESSLAKIETAWMAGRAEALLRDYRQLRLALANAHLGPIPEAAK